MSKDRIWTLLSRKLSGEATGAELSELDELFHKHPDSLPLAQTISEHWNIPAEKDADFLEATYHLHTQRLKNNGYDLETNKPVIEGLFNLEESATPKRLKKVLWSSAALAALVLVIVLSVYKQSNGSQQADGSQSEVSTKNGSRTKMTLPDGTLVWLNSNSKLVYDNKTFGTNTREVILTGEGYFDVVKNPAKPFIIHTPKINIKVLGTVFNVKAYPEDKQTETSLLRGSIEVTINNRPKDKIILSPNEKLIINNAESKAREDVANTVAAPVKVATDKTTPAVLIDNLTYNPKDSTLAETDWVYNKLVFRDESFEEVALRMQRWYDVDIEIKDKKLKTERLTVTFINETVTQALDALKFSIAFKYSQNGKKIIIYQ
jgi:transmembrane sensor